MIPSYSQLQVVNESLSIETWTELIKCPMASRPAYSSENGTIRIGRILVCYLGIPHDEDQYYNDLFDYVHSQEMKLQLLSDEALDKSIDNQRFQAIQRVINIHQEQKLSINRFVAFMDGDHLIVKSQNALLNRRIREAWKSLLSAFQEKESGGLKNPDLRRVITDVVKWSINHLQKGILEADPEREMPRFLWYGDVKKSHEYFIFLLAEIGCDIVYYHPGGMSMAAGFMEGSLVHEFPNRKPPEPFPQEKRARQTTVAYRASREIEAILNQEGSGLYKPWQLRDYVPNPITLRTTYDELFILAKESAMIRPDFEVKDGQVKIPVLFAKIQGISRNKKEYWDRLHQLSQVENTLLIRYFPFTSESSNDFRFHYRSSLGQDALPDVEKMMSSHYWTYKHLPGGLQKGIASAIRRMCDRPDLKRLPKETEEETKVYLFSQATQAPKQFIQLLERFDYSQQVPKLIIYNNETAGFMTRADAALLLLLNSFGIDIAIYNPAGHNDIEKFVSESLYDTHWLEDVAFELEYKEPSIMKKGLLQGLFKNLRGD